MGCVFLFCVPACCGFSLMLGKLFLGTLFIYSAEVVKGKEDVAREAAAECKPRCSLPARATICINGPAEGRGIVDCRGHHERKTVASGGRVFPANVQNVVNEVIESAAPLQL